jgi:hypothetical protein
MVAYAVVWFAVALPLVEPLGAPAVGIGWIAGSAVNATILAWQTRRRTGASIAVNFLPAGIVAGIAGGAGWLVATAGERTVLHGLLGALGAEAVLLALLAVARPALLRSAYALLKEAMPAARREPPADLA